MESLSFAHANALNSALTRIEDFVLEVRGILELPSRPGFRGYTDFPSQGEQLGMQSTLDRLMEEVLRMRATFDLDTEPANARRRIRHQAALILAELGDMRASALGRYGALEPDTAARIDRSIERIVLLLREL